MKPIVLKSKRLTIHPMDEKELNSYIDTLPDRDLRNAYAEILRKIRNNPDNLPWYTYWQICEKRTVIGGILFYGIPNARHEASVSYGIEEEFQGQGYEEEAVSLIRKWIFRNHATITEGGRTLIRRCYYLSVKNEISDIKGRKMLEHLGFTMVEPSEDNPENAYCVSFEQEAPKFSLTAIGVFAGLMIGLLFAWFMSALHFRESGELAASEGFEFLPYVLICTAVCTVGGLLIDFIEKQKRKR